MTPDPDLDPDLNETVLRNARPQVAAWLTEFVERNGGWCGSVHLPDSAGPAGADREIVLVAAHNLPVAVQNITAVIPFGKGMAGTAAQRRETVVIPDFQTDTTGVAAVGGRPVRARGSLAVPVYATDDHTQLVAVVGLGFTERRDFTEAEVAAYGRDAATVLTVS
ncbi:GAF domain-containing protein [Streptomyces sp. ME02-8801-2C]|uniref:GAF domain-containing protein n=1 Tax=Streptomyces sp. ME02-8801-2C TaxID=3028680 RepID=UPI0029A0B4A1|nr:GAF domain-containing protein [Streptomyces sp. ME02-8801-2C]MDX3453285.1 GAF domain-containing protein [Streptomyces sp. ME02-8801-2C]